MTDEYRIVERMAERIYDCDRITSINGELSWERCQREMPSLASVAREQARAAYSIAKEEIERELRDRPATPILHALSDKELAVRMRHHVMARNGLPRDAVTGDLILPNGAWAMLMEAADRLDTFATRKGE